MGEAVAERDSASAGMIAGGLRGREMRRQVRESLGRDDELAMGVLQAGLEGCRVRAEVPTLLLADFRCIH
jgi:hypothetical protein